MLWLGWRGHSILTDREEDGECERQKALVYAYRSCSPPKAGERRPWVVLITFW